MLPVPTTAALPTAVNYENGQPVALQPSGNHADNVRFTYSEATGKWTGSYQLYWKDKQTPIDAYGYYPFDADLQSTQSYPFTVQQNQRDHLKTGRKLLGYEQSDFLWAKKENIVPTTGAVTLQHHHLMAGIKVILTEGHGFNDGEWDELQKSVLVESTVLESTINLQTGTVTPSGSKTGVITPLPQQGGEGTFYRAIVVPQTVAAGKSLFALTIDNKSYHFTRDEAMTYLSGKLHQFTFDVQKSLETGDYQLTLISESVTAWDNDQLSHNGSAREYVVVHVNEYQYLGDAIAEAGLDPELIVNLKITGTLGKVQLEGSKDNSPRFTSGNCHFEYIRSHMPNLEAINLMEVEKLNGPADNNAWSWWQIMNNNYNASNPYEQDVDVYDGCLPAGAFSGMMSLNYIVWPTHLEAIGNGAFKNTSLRGSLIFPEGLQYIGTGPFEQTATLTGELYIPSSVKYISYGAFSGLPLHGEVVLPEHMIYLGDNAFGRCDFLTGQIHIPEGLDVVNKAFAPNMTAKVVQIPQGVKRVNGIGGQPASVIFPEGVEEIGSEAFWGVSSLQGDLKLPTTLRTIGRSAFNGTHISHVSLPEGLEIINQATFRNCHYLQDTLIIPSTVTQIQENAFGACEKLDAVILPAGLEEIQQWAFDNCRSLYYIQCLNPVPPVLNSSAFNGVEKNECALVVPVGSVEAYRNAEGWREFKRISAYQNFVCRPMQAKLLNKGNTRTIVLNSDGNWKVTDCPEWIHPSKTNGYKKTEMTVTIDALPHGSADREGSIVFTLTDKTDEQGHPITCNYTVKQFDYEYDEDGQTQLLKSTRGNGINIVFVGDGYDAEDIARGRYLENMLEGMEYFFAIEPYKTYKDYFNVYADMAMSYESGVCSNVNIWRQTKFGTTYGSGDNGRLGINDADVFNYVLNDVSGSAITQQNMNQSLIICVPNDDGYEGVTAMYSSGAAVAFVPHSRFSYPNDYRGLIQHEAGGHGFGKLGDEYVYHRDNIWTCACVCCAHANVVMSDKALGWYRNLSLNGRYKEVDWSHLISDPRYRDIVDIYEGGYRHGQGIYRSEVNSCMNNNVPYYSTISRQAIVERIKQYAGEPFAFEQFVANDSREMGEKFLTRSEIVGGVPPTEAMHNSMPVIRKGSPLDYLKKKGGSK